MTSPLPVVRLITALKTPLLWPSGTPTSLRRSMVSFLAPMAMTVLSKRASYKPVTVTSPSASRSWAKLALLFLVLI